MAEPFQAPPSGKDTFAPSDPAAGEVGKMEKWARHRAPFLVMAPGSSSEILALLGMSCWKKCAKMSSHISSLYLVYTCISRNIPKKSPSNGQTVFAFSTATKTRGVSHVIWDSSTCNYSNWLISFHKNSHSFQCIMHIYYSAYITNESFLVDMGPLPIVI